MPAKTAASEPASAEQPVEESPVYELADDGEAGALAALEAANYARAHKPNPIVEE